MSEFNLEILEITNADKEFISDFITENWGSHFSVSKGKMHDVVNLPGFICKHDDKIAGLITYHIENEGCEIVTLNSKIGNKGLGSQLIQKVLEVAKEHLCNRVWLITTNDNIQAIRFYQKRGFDWIDFHRDVIDESRKLKPEIPKLGNDDIPIRHEIEFEYRLNY